MSGTQALCPSPLPCGNCGQPPSGGPYLLSSLPPSSMSSSGWGPHCAGPLGPCMSYRWLWPLAWLWLLWCSLWATSVEPMSILLSLLPSLWAPRCPCSVPFATWHPSSWELWLGLPCCSVLPPPAVRGNLALNTVRTSCVGLREPGALTPAWCRWLSTPGIKDILCVCVSLWGRSADTLEG